MASAASQREFKLLAGAIIRPARNEADFENVALIMGKVCRKSTFGWRSVIGTSR